MLDLSPSQLVLVTQVLGQYVPGMEVWAFGSRVDHTAKPWSDLDLVVISPQGLPMDQLFALQEAFSDSDLPMRVDVLDWHQCSPEFLLIIQSKYFKLC